MSEEYESIVFVDEEDNEVELTVLESTTVAGVRYLLVCDGDEEEEEAQAYIFKEEKEEGEEIVYAPVDNEEELNAVFKVFEQLVEDIDFVD